MKSVNSTVVVGLILLGSALSGCVDSDDGNTPDELVRQFMSDSRLIDAADAPAWVRAYPELPVISAAIQRVAATNTRPLPKEVASATSAAACDRIWGVYEGALGSGNSSLAFYMMASWLEKCL